MSKPVTFVAGQRARLIKPFTGHSLRLIDAARDAFGPKRLATLPAGTSLVVARTPKADCNGRAAIETVLVWNKAGTWCVPARLLELDAVPSDNAVSSQGART